MFLKAFYNCILYILSFSKYSKDNGLKCIQIWKQRDKILLHHQIKRITIILILLQQLFF